MSFSCRPFSQGTCAAPSHNDKLLLLTTIDGSLHALDAVTGSALWVMSTGGALVSLTRQNHDRGGEEDYPEPFVPDLTSSQQNTYHVQNGTLARGSSLPEMLRSPFVQLSDKLTLITSSTVSVVQVDARSGAVESEDIRNATAGHVPITAASLRIHRSDVVLTLHSPTHCVWKMVIGALHLTLAKGSSPSSGGSSSSDLIVCVNGQVEAPTWCADLGADIVMASVFDGAAIYSIPLVDDVVTTTVVVPHGRTPLGVTTRSFNGASYAVSFPKNNENRTKQPQIEMPREYTTSSSSRYILGDVIGTGGYANVHLGLDITTGEHIAIKKMRWARSKVDALQQEFEILTMLRHKHVVGVRGFDVIDGDHACIYMEWMPGGSIANMVYNSVGFRLPENLIRRYAHHTLLGLAYLHENNVIHRDVKPANMLVTLDGTLKLSDFGNSKVTEDLGTTTSTMGTPIYMSPECNRGKWTKAGDVWSLGASITEMASGVPPWAELALPPHSLKSHLEYCFHIGTVPSGEEESHHPQIPETLSAEGRDFISRCFKIDPTERWTCEQLLSHPFVGYPDGQHGGAQWEELDEYVAQRQALHAPALRALTGGDTVTF